MTILAFILTIGILVAVHEYGHFQMAKWCGVKVLKFSLGFGKPLWSKKFGADQTEFVIAAIPLGGYVKMLGEEALSEVVPQQDAFRALNKQSVGKRMAIVVAGPLANLLLAVLLYWGLFMLGVAGLKPLVGDVVANSPAALTSMRSGELIQKVNHQPVLSWQDVRWALLKASLKHQQVNIQTIDQHQEIRIHQIKLANVDFNDDRLDILDKIGLSMCEPNISALIGSLVQHSPAEKAGLKMGDLILQVNEVQISNWEQFVSEVKSHPAQPLRMLIQRQTEKVALTITPESVNEGGKQVGRIGAAFDSNQPQINDLLVTTRYSFAEAFIKAMDKTWDTAIFSLKMLGNMIQGNVSWKGISGPITIASYAGQSVNMGAKVFISFLALISISIGVLNLLPIPILDGGHLMYYMAEFLTGKPVSEDVQNIGQRLGLLLISLMMFVALYNDMSKLITG